ncbi:alpha/beta-hydrolase [Myriangium duriaei CBS 260.36]|uniref:Alpha/beta-hydrolase n=1 Tax=Myriangium duriaei CBS 260.36 TaxID=1168546 RepID=A0A9P4MG70_9PEZI|nr:alpha/beta-hydrolase [Myriangium duriaei CBS 260.36]
MAPKPGGSLPPLPIPSGVQSSYVDCTSSCGLNFHILSAGKEEGVKRPLILLMHGYPEIAFSWRIILLKLAAQGFYVVAPDQRGYGRTTGWDTRPFDKVDLRQFTITNLVRDVVCLTYALGYEKVYSIIGHDFGAVTSAMCPLIRPDIFTSCIQMSHPHHAPPTPAFDVGDELNPSSEKTPINAQQGHTIQDDLAALYPPRKHYKWYNSTQAAADDWYHPPQGLRDFLRGYFHLKSANWAKNDPRPLAEWSARELAKMPEYYVLPKDMSMPEAVEELMQGESTSASKRWLSDGDLAVYVFEWSRTGFQGGLNWYRAQTSSSSTQQRDMLLFAGRKIEVPCTFISGEKDWGTYQQPGAFDKYHENCTDFRGTTIIKGAGHWVQQEQPEKTMEAILAFFKGIEAGKEPAETHERRESRELPRRRK